MLLLKRMSKQALKKLIIGFDLTTNWANSEILLLLYIAKPAAITKLFSILNTKNRRCNLVKKYEIWLGRGCKSIMFGKSETHDDSYGVTRVRVRHLPGFSVRSWCQGRGG